MTADVRSACDVLRPVFETTGGVDGRVSIEVSPAVVEELVAPQTVNTMPQKTLEAVWDHGVIASDTVTGHYGDARRVIAELTAVGIPITDVAATLETAGIATFAASWERLLASVGAA